MPEAFIISNALSSAPHHSNLAKEAPDRAKRTIVRIYAQGFPMGDL